eukprot:scaffold10364_cov61-Attheya_sp.AAC.5
MVVTTRGMPQGQLPMAATNPDGNACRPDKCNATQSGMSVLTMPTADYLAQESRIPTPSVTDQPEQTITYGTVTHAMQQHDQDPTSTIALEIKRAKTFLEVTLQQFREQLFQIQEINNLGYALHSQSKVTDRNINGLARIGLGHWLAYDL